MELLALLLTVMLVLLGLVLVVTLYNAFTAPLLERPPVLDDTPFVSVLVPARNEAANIMACLSGLQQQRYARFEIIVLDDHSSDATSALAGTLAAHDRRIRVLAGEPLPAGWTGKNWACHQLGKHARGEILIFTDADCRHRAGVIAATVAWMRKYHLGVLTTFPQQITVTLPEKLVVPVIYMLVYSYLPLWLTYYSTSPALAAANGQWLAFTREAYDRLGGHAALAAEVVEDVALSRRAKQHGEKMLVLAGNHAVQCRMYQSWRGVWEGFSKNAFGLAGHQTTPFFLLLLLLFGVHVLPFVLIWLPPLAKLAALGIAMNLALRLVLAVKYQQPVLSSIFLHPFAVVFTLLIGLNSYRWFRSGKIVWKDRRVPSQRRAAPSASRAAT
ncbi:MAG: glycosyltransferase [candidate division KSB1 bacterium]|nr:glycosyltransferase [candidate division KSB1 bacterium]MDZ7272646.1 glycosyltransferase [candidate division KSB1 bacterium]MDZ7284332.1 glycosyltransferase [candidate division KSB1 bacterium]MDZ7297272.1 glycosyltransferase [candidate division KSB1 bacterium]MDZ7309045.1 glycosyltransferase [candidate division KSB1 bacterium]